jgi:hypothetical protein
MTDHEARRVTIDLANGRGKVLIGDVDVSMLVTMLAVNMSVGARPCVHLIMEPEVISMRLDGADVELDYETCSVLKALGWVPSEER